jgi:TRAP-type mannitol/chloroaromatic compound transport system substrate-binding protein
MTKLTTRRDALRGIAGAGVAGAATLAAPNIATAQGQTTTWKIQTSWPGGAGPADLQGLVRDHCREDRRRTGVRAVRRQ